MKNLSTIPSFSLFGAITILITIVVCLAGFAGSEMPPGYKANDRYRGVGKEMVEEEQQPQEKIASLQQTSNSRGDDDELSEQTNFANYFKNLQREGNFGQQMKRHSENVRKDSIQREFEAENDDGYENGDDEYYHFDIKREGNLGGHADEARESEKKDADNKLLKTKNDKEDETIELLNFSQTHSKTGASDASQNILKNLPDKTSASHGQSSSLKMSDLKGNSGINEKEKNTKDESDTSSVNSEKSGDQKLSPPKKEDAPSEEKDLSKLKDSKLETESEKKGNDANVKGNSDNLTGKNAKDNAKTIESKARVDQNAKPAKLKSESNSGGDSSEKSSLKDRGKESSKLVKDEKDSSKLMNKLNSEDASKSQISQNDNKANLVSNDFKDSGKLPSLDEEDKESDEMSDKTMNIRFYQGDIKQKKEGDEMAKNFELLNEKQRNMEGASRSKVKDIFTFPIAFEIKNENAKDMYKSQDQNKGMESVQKIEQPDKPFHLNFSPSELENTDYHKNFIKSLRRYKGLDDSPKPVKDSYGLQPGGYHNPVIARGNQPLTKTSKIRKRKSKIECDADGPERDHVKVKKSSCSVENEPVQGTEEPEKNSLIGKKNDNMDGNNRRRRKSPQKFEYKIKIINEPVEKNSGSTHSHQKRKKKDIKSKQTEGKSFRKSPFSQVLLEDLTKLNYQKNDRSLKRRESTWFGEGEYKSSEGGEQGIFKIRGLPSGYYTNRVKFGNKHFLRNEESEVAPRRFRNAAWLSDKNSPSKASLSSLHDSWNVPKLQETKHDPEKRLAGNSIFNQGRGNSLLLVKKGRNGDRITKTFTDETKDDSQKNPESEELARILSQDSDYIVLKKTDSNKYQKITLNNLKDGFNANRAFRSVPRSDVRYYNFPAGVPEKFNAYSRSLTRLYRSSDQKSHSPSTISTSLKKTFEKFKDLADFFKDNEQESAQENRHQTQELKENSDIVFSEDKLPEPLVINSEVDERNPKFKSQNSITSISTNFRQLDQDRKDDLCKDYLLDSKGENPVSQWKPALKNAFPEAKSVSSVMKDGKEIILIDLNKNELMMNHKGHNVLGSSTSGSSGSDKSSKPLIIPGNRQVEIIWNSNPNPNYLDQTISKNVLDKKYPLDRAFERFYKFPEQESKAPLSGQPLVTMPLNDLAQLSILLKQINEKKEALAENQNKILRKKSPAAIPTLKTSSNIAQFLQDYRKLSEINNEQLPKKISITKKRDSSNSYFRTFPELSSYSDSNEKDVRDILETPGAKENSKRNGLRGAETEENKQANFKGWQNEERKSELGFSNSEKLESNLFPKLHGQWTSAKDSKDYVPFKNAWNEYNTKELKNDLGGGLQSEDIQDSANENDYQEELLEELSEASNKIERLRREGADDQSLRKTMENALPYKAGRKSESSENEKVTSDSKLTKEDIKDSNADLNEKDSKEKDSAETPNSIANADLTAEVEKDKEKDLQEESQVKEIHENKAEPLQKIDEKNQLRESLESINLDNFDVNELAEARYERENERNPIRRKRSPEAKVSTTEVENTIISNFTEDNYQSVYSPGIKRKLLSIDDGDSDRYYNADENSENVSESICVRNAAPDCTHSVISNCLHERETENDINRGKRSLTDNFHSNHKREIDLDESMPNDFQNFLETSLGLDSHVSVIGGQKREAIKKEETRKENKEAVQGKNDPVAYTPSGVKVREDSPLEKREVSENEKDKSPFTDFDSKMGKASSPNVKAEHSAGKFGDKYDSKLGLSELESEKLPTQIRIQITKSTAKDKKPENSILDESDITSNEMEGSFKEKEFLNKNKFQSSNFENLYSTSKIKNPFSTDYGYDKTSMDFGNQKYYMMAQPVKKKKRKFLSENYEVSPAELNQKLKEGLIRKYVSDRNLYEATTQRVPVSNHLPQVETVYNPTQGANKAQVQGCRLSLKENKNVNSKNSLQPPETVVLNDKLLKYYLNDKQDSQLKSGKDEPKDTESFDWKPYARKMKLRQDPSSAQIPSYKSLGGDSSYPTLKSRSMFRKSTNQLKQLQKPYAGYLNRNPAEPVMSSDSIYDSGKQKPDFLWNGLTKDTFNSKLYKDASVNLDFSDAKDNTPNSNYKFEDTPWKEYNSYYSDKNPSTYKFRNYISSSVVNALSDRSLNSQKYLKSLQDNAPNGADVANTLDNLKDADYLDNIEHQYNDNDDFKQEGQIGGDNRGKKGNKLFGREKYKKIVGYSVLDEGNAPSSNSGEEVNEDYGENNEEDWDDYSLLSFSNSEREKAKKPQDDEKIISSYHSIEPLYTSLQYKTSKLQQGKGSINQAELKNNKNDEKSELGAQSLTYAEPVKEATPLLNSLNVLKIANENSNVLGKNLMKNLQKYNYDSNLRSEGKFRSDRSFFRGSKYPSFKEKEKLSLSNVNWPSKYKRSQGLTQVGNRYIYATKTESFDLKDFQPKKYVSYKKNSRSNHYQLPKSNPLNAELRGMENELEYESEDNNKYFDENILSSGKGDFTKERSQLRSCDEDSIGEADDHDKKKRSSFENLQDDDETISDDGVLENVIGKYIMRKSVKINPEKKIRNNGFEPVGIEKNKLESSSDDKHKPEKRSVSSGIHPEQQLNIRKIRGKRFSTGHLTENNYKKFHKKNFSRKRRVTEADISDFGARKIFTERSRRCGRGLFRKLSKEKENKKADVPDSKTAGFEPILWDSRGDNSRNVKQESQPRSDNVYTLYSSNQHALHEKVGSDNEKETSSSSQMRGPWKIRLNEKNVKVSSEQGAKQSKTSFDESDLKEKAGEALASNGIEAYLVIRNNLRDGDSSRTSGEDDDFSPTSGESEKEVGNSYRLFHDGGEEILRKRSGRSYSAKDRLAALAENSISLEESGKDLEKMNNFLEGDSKAQAPFDDQKNANFVNVQGQRLRFGDKNKILSNGILRKSVVLPLSTDANIIGDSRHINEETSKNLGQQIVEAILTHVSTNPRFKQVIAPGLSGKSPNYRQTVKSGKSTSTKIKYPDQVQNFLQTVMHHIEIMAENDVKKRMCNKIDRQSKEFLRSMLEFPEITPPRSCKQKKGFFVDPPCPETCPKSCNSNRDMMPSTMMPLPPIAIAPPMPMPNSCGPALKASICEALRKKKEVLKKLIEDYQRLSELEREAINISFQFLVAQLEDTEQLLEFLNGCGECYHPPDSPPTEINLLSSTEHTSSVPSQEVAPNFQLMPSQAPVLASMSTIPNLPNVPSLPALSQKNFSHVFHFEPEECRVRNCTSEGATQTRPPSSTINPLCCPSQQDNVEGGFEKVSSSNEPQTFDLLPNHGNNSVPGKPGENLIRSRNTDKSENTRFNVPSPQGLQTPANLQNLAFSNNQIGAVSNYRPRQEELNKLGIGDAAGLQLPHDYLSPWVSNLDIAKQKKVTNQNVIFNPVNPSFPAAVKDYRSSKNAESDFAVKNSKKAKIRISEDRLGFSGSSDAKPYSRLENPNLQYSVGRFPDPSTFRDENSKAVKKIRTKRRTMRYNVKRKKKRNLMRNKFRKVTNEKKKNSDYEEDPEMEYLIWASMPAVRRRLNDLEQGIDVDKNAAQLLLENMGGERAEKEEKERINRFKLLGLKK